MMAKQVADREVLSSTDTYAVWAHQLADCILHNYQLSFGKLPDPDVKHLLKRPAAMICRYVLDFLLSTFLIAPSVVLVWRGIWDHANIYLDARLFHGDAFRANMASLGLGLVGTQVIHWSQHSIRSQVAGGTKATSFRFYLVSRVFSLVWGFFDIMLWKGIWDGYNSYFGIHWTTASLTLVIGLAVLTVSKAFRSVLSVPVGIVMDDKDVNCCVAATYFETKEDDHLFRRLADNVISVALESCVVGVWHGLWTMEDLLTDLLQFDHLTTGFISLAFGVLLHGIFFIGQFPFALYCQKFWKNNEVTVTSSQVLMNFGITFIGVLATINCFRGYWYIMDEFLPKLFMDNVELSYIHGIFYGLLILYFCHCGGCMHAGIAKDIVQGALSEINFSNYFYIKRHSGHRYRAVNGWCEDPPLLLITHSPTQIIPEEFRHHDHIDVGYLGEDILNAVEQDIEGALQLKIRSQQL